MNNSCDTPRSIPPLDTSRGVREKDASGYFVNVCREKERERELFNGAFIVRPENEKETRRNRSEKILLVPFLSNPSVQLPPRHVGENPTRVGNRGVRRKKRGEKSWGERAEEGQRTKGRGTRDEWARRGGERGCVRLDDPDGAHNLPIGTLHYSCLQLRAANQPLLLPPPSPVICLGQIQSQPRGGFELTINFKRVRRRRPRATAAGEGGERRTQTVFSRVSDRRSAKGINLS